MRRDHAAVTHRVRRDHAAVTHRVRRDHAAVTHRVRRDHAAVEQRPQAADGRRPHRRRHPPRRPHAVRYDQPPHDVAGVRLDASARRLGRRRRRGDETREEREELQTQLRLLLRSEDDAKRGEDRGEMLADYHRTCGTVWNMRNFCLFIITFKSFYKNNPE